LEKSLSLIFAKRWIYRHWIGFGPEAALKLKVGALAMFHRYNWKGSLVFWAAAYILLFSYSGARAGVVTGQVQCEGACIIRNFGISGVIDGQVVTDFEHLIAQAKQRAGKRGKDSYIANTQVKLNSPGGSVRDASCCC
jgi:hypothetical protein